MKAEQQDTMKDAAAQRSRSALARLAEKAQALHDTPIDQWPEDVRAHLMEETDEVLAGYRRWWKLHRR